MLERSGFLALLFFVVSSIHATDSQPVDGNLTKQQVEKSDSDLKPLNKSETVLLDIKGKKLLLKSEIVLREGLLEMLVCLKRSKEHESILAVDTKAQIVHAGLLALGCQPGSPVHWEPEFRPPTGQQIDIFFAWTDEQGKPHREAAQKWVRHATRKYFVEKLDHFSDKYQLPENKDLKWDPKHKELFWYGQMSEAQRYEWLAHSKDQGFQNAIKSIYKQSQIRPMEGNWVFAGSYFLTDEKTGEKFYQAESGDLICVANFATATLDLSASSSASNDDLMFEAFTENIPPVGTKVMIELVPQFQPQKKAEVPAK